MIKKDTVYPFPAIVGQDDMKLALVLNVINPGLSGVLIRGEKGTAKSTAVRSLAEILPEIEVIKDCMFQMDIDEAKVFCETCPNDSCRSRHDPDGAETFYRKVKVVELPVGATEDRVVGALDIESALKTGEKKVEPGILAQAHRGILYVDEVNLLDDHIVDILLDAAAMGVNTVEREGVSFSHPSRFTLVGTMNPEEGELRPQLLDRFGLCVNIEGIKNPEDRVRIMEQRIEFEEDPNDFALRWLEPCGQLSEKIAEAISRYPHVKADHSILMEIANFCLSVGVDGHRGDIITLKTAKTLAAYDGGLEVTSMHVDSAAELALPHRLRRQPLQDIVVDVKSLRKV